MGDSGGDRRMEAEEEEVKIEDEVDFGREIDDSAIDAVLKQLLTGQLDGNNQSLLLPPSQSDNVNNNSDNSKNPNMVVQREDGDSLKKAEATLTGWPLPAAAGTSSSTPYLVNHHHQAQPHPAYHDINYHFDRYPPHQHPNSTVTSGAYQHHYSQHLHSAPLASPPPAPSSSYAAASLTSPALASSSSYAAASIPPPGSSSFAPTSVPSSSYAPTSIASSSFAPASLAPTSIASLAPTSIASSSFAPTSSHAPTSIASSSATGSLASSSYASPSTVAPTSIASSSVFSTAPSSLGQYRISDLAIPHVPTQPPPPPSSPSTIIPHGQFSGHSHASNASSSTADSGAHSWSPNPGSPTGHSAVASPPAVKAESAGAAEASSTGVAAAIEAEQQHHVLKQQQQQLDPQQQLQQLQHQYPPPPPPASHYALPYSYFPGTASAAQLYLQSQSQLQLQSYYQQQHHEALMAQQQQQQQQQQQHFVVQQPQLTPQELAASYPNLSASQNAQPEVAASSEEAKKRKKKVRKGRRSSKCVCENCQNPPPAHLRVKVRRDKHDKPLHPCMHCDKMYSKTSHLKAHIRTHFNERPFTCADCKRTFTRSDELTRHRRIHMGTVGKRFKCDQCDAGFTRSDHLKKHVRVHLPAEQRPPRKRPGRPRKRPLPDAADTPATVGVPNVNGNVPSAGKGASKKNKGKGKGKAVQQQQQQQQQQQPLQLIQENVTVEHLPAQPNVFHNILNRENVEQQKENVLPTYDQQYQVFDLHSGSYQAPLGLNNFNYGSPRYVVDHGGNDIVAAAVAAAANDDNNVNGQDIITYKEGEF